MYRIYRKILNSDQGNFQSLVKTLKWDVLKEIEDQGCPNQIFLSRNSNGPRQANLVLIAYASSEGSGEPAPPRSLARTFAARSYKQ